MYDSSEELLRQIRLGEDTSLELKAVRFQGDRVSAPRQENLADEIAAIANTHDGVLVLGVDDKTRDIDGIPLEKLEVVERLVFEACNASITPPVVFRAFRLELPDSAGVTKAILKVEVPRSLFVHKSPGGYFHRQGSSKREMPPDLLFRMAQQRSQTRPIRFDEQIVSAARLADLDPALWRGFAGSSLSGKDEDILIKLGMARKDEDGAIRPTVTGILMATREPRQWMSNAFVQAVAYRGTTIFSEDDTNYQLDAVDMSGPLNDQIMNACAFVRKNMKVAARKDLGRTDLPQYDMTAVFEAMVNAVAHRDYSIHGSKIRLRMFADRLEIYSPGTIPNTMTIESLPYRQSSRNETISSLLARCPIPDPGLAQHRSHMMDKRGEGVPIILERSAKLSGRTPEYKLIDNTELLLTIWSARQSEPAIET
ncbi:MAG: ATP-binding protein [Syntrophales bacterium]|nr:ATP-binding protein [Syntrophales bacterium]